MKKRGQNSIYGLAEREEILHEYSQSGLSQQEYCQQRGIKFSTFKNWKYSKLMIKGPVPSSFIEVKIKEQSKITTCSQTMVKIIHPNGMTIEIPSMIERKELSTLLELLGMKI